MGQTVDKQTRIPILVIGDSPSLPTGLGRVARDVATGIWQDRDVLGVDLAQLGIYHDEEAVAPWPIAKVRDEENWAAADLPKVWWRFFGNRRGVVLTVWDPARCFELSVTAADVPVQLWGYFAIDSSGVGDRLNGPVVSALRRYQRVLGYGEWGAGVLRRTLDRPVSWLPHGISTGIFQPRGLSLACSPAEGISEAVPNRRDLVGCVAANQPRKDLGLLFEAWQMMAEKDASLQFWLHTDVEVKHWSVAQLAEDFGLEDRLSVSLTGNDEFLASMYSRCLITMAPGLGEGFGYPIVESLACGAPVVHLEHGGGAELIPRADWRVVPTGWRWESVHVVRRPVVAARNFAQAGLAAVADARMEPDVTAAYCRGAVAHLDWATLWPRWRSWVAAGLTELR